MFYPSYHGAGTKPLFYTLEYCCSLLTMEALGPPQSTQNTFVVSQI